MANDLAVAVLWGALIHTVALLTVVAISTVRTDRSSPRFSDIRIWLRGLLLNGGDGETFLFRHSRTERFVRFEKYSDGGRGIGVVLTFPEVRWGRDHISDLRAYCADHGLPFRASSDDKPGGQGFARIDFGNDLDAAWALTKRIWHQYLGHEEQDGHVCVMNDLLSASDLTATPPLLPDRLEELKRFTRSTRVRLKHAGLAWLGPFSFAAVLFAAAAAWVVTAVWLPVSTLSSIGEPADWQLAVGPVRAAGGGTSLVLFFVYLASMAVALRCMRFPLVNLRQWNGIEYFVHRPKRLVWLAMPIAVVVTWMGV